MKKSTFIITLVIFGLLAGCAYIPGVLGLIIFGPDIGKVAYSSNPKNYTVIEREVSSVILSENSIDHIVLSGSPWEKYIFAVDKATVARSGLNDIIKKGITVKLTTIEAPSPETYYIAALSYNGEEYIDFNNSRKIIVKEYNNINKKASVLFSVSCSVFVIGLIGIITVVIVHKKSKRKKPVEEQPKTPTINITINKKP